MLGGFLNALMLAATRKYVELEFGPGRYPDPVHVFVQFLSMVPPGPVAITCHTLRTSSRQCVLRVELCGNRPESAQSQSSTTVAIVTYGDLSKEKGLSQDTRPAIPIPLPQRQTECVPIDDPVVDATPVTRKLHWIAPKGANGLWGHRLGGHHREVWLSPRDGSKMSSIFHLALLADLVSDRDRNNTTKLHVLTYDSLCNRQPPMSKDFIPATPYQHSACLWSSSRNPAPIRNG